MDKYAWWTKFLPLLLWIGMILGVASRPKTAFLSQNTNAILEMTSGGGIRQRFIQYPYHIGSFFILTILFLRFFLAKSARKDTRKSEILSLLGSALVSICSELIQFYVPTRSPNARDLALDLFGTVLGILLMRWMRPAI
jgi:VanZ family protein